MRTSIILLLCLLPLGCAGSADARLREQIRLAEGYAQLHVRYSRPIEGMSPEDVQAYEKNAQDLLRFFEAARGVK